MAYIETIEEDGAEGALGALYRRLMDQAGRVDNILKVHSLNPGALEAHLALYGQAMHARSPLDRRRRELLAVHVSRLNGCRY